ncbi:MAG TPA: hypothetical protein VFU82_02875 [Gammaproteobacteria bacterium]|jgi:hypothetical protein|nr:hypothetical protein [Gammaproteobacteria bacterium]
MQEASGQALSTAIDFERELKNPQSPLFKQYVALLEKAADEQACLIQLFEYWASQAAQDEINKSHQAWLEEGREEAKLAMAQQPVIDSMLPKDSMPDDINELDTLLDSLMEKQHYWESRIEDLSREVKVCDRKLGELDKQWNNAQTEKTDHLVTDLKTQFEAGNLRDPQGIPMPPPLPDFLNKLSDAMHVATPQKQCEVNPSLLDQDARQAVRGGNVMAQLRMVAAMVEQSAKDNIHFFAEAGLAFIRNNKTMPKPVETDKEVSAFEGTQSAMKQRETAKEAKGVAEKNLAVVNQDIEKVNEAKAELGYSRPRPNPPC